MRLQSFLLLIFLATSLAVDESIFKKCAQSSFCRRCRNYKPDVSPYEVVTNTLSTFTNHITLDIVNKENDHIFELKLEGLRGNTFHFEIDEKTPLKPRYRVTDALRKELTYESIKVTSTASEITVTSAGNKVVISISPLKLEFYQGENLITSVNSRSLMKFEHLQVKPEPPPDNGDWEEDYNGFPDSKPNGPSAVAMDFTFHKAEVLFGIPEHADDFSLLNTGVDEDPYRLYNLDVFEYEIESKMSLYGSVPVIYGHGTTSTSGIFWQNAAETWIDIADGIESRSAHFMSESGIVDVFVLLGPTPIDAMRQYTELTGTGNLPQMFALGYHQCRWNYNDEQDLMEVATNFDLYDIPMDTMWLDIEYTDDKKYFTWNHTSFPNPIRMMDDLREMGRRLTFIIDPHVKRADDYFFHNDCTDKNFYVKNKNGTDYEGWCWPGSSSYTDMFNPAARHYYADQYLMENFQENAIDTGIWNDMNEPSVFNGPEITMLKDNLHFGGWEHRDVHNLYGQMQLMATYDGLTRRASGTLRPFILTRAHFAGTQRYAAVWTGDNTAEWGYLAHSIKMCLSLAVSGISFCGADVGGFFKDPEAELFSRWYQAGAFQPFFRSHSNIDYERREPWLFPNETMMIIRDAIRKRYSYLPLWYTMFYEHERSGLPIMRPMLLQYPLDRNGFSIDDQYMLSDKLLVHPVPEKNLTSVSVYFPSTESGESKVGDIWYDVDDYSKIDVAGAKLVPTDAYKIPVYQRGGTIVPKKHTIKQTTALMQDDPYTLIVATDGKNQAKGTLYIDDEKSFEYRQGKYLYLEFELVNGTLSSRHVDQNATYDTKSVLERVVIVGMEKVPENATITSSDDKLTLLEIIDVQATSFTISVKDANVNMADEWTIIFDKSSATKSSMFGLMALVVIVVVCLSSF